MKNKNFPIAWILIGSLELFFGISGYIRYSNGGMMYTFMIPEQIEVKNILFGLISIVIGIGLFINPKQQLKLIYLFPIWVITFILTGTIQSLIKWDYFGLEYIFILDYWFLIISFHTLREFKKDIIISKLNLIEFVKSNWVFTISSAVFINLLIFTLAELMPYEIFY